MVDQEEEEVLETPEETRCRYSLNRLEALEERLGSFTTNIKKTGRERLTESFLNSKLETLIQMKAQFDECLLEYSSVLSKSKRASLPFFTTDRPAVFEKDFDDIREWINVVLVKVKPFVRSSEDSHNSQNNPGPQNIVITPPVTDTLKKVAIPVFNGEPEEWPQFRDLFTSIVHNHPTISGVQKFQNLKAYIKGKAEIVIREIVISEANYVLAWEAMLKAFNNPRLLVDNQLKVLLELNQVMSESAQEVKNLMYSVANAYQSVINQNFNIAAWDYWLVYIVVRKLPFQTKLLWEQSLVNQQNLPTFVLLRTFLEERCRTLESMSSMAPKTQRSSFRAPQLAKNFRLLSAACSMCHKEHPIDKCGQFLKMSVAQRKTTVKDLKLCINCLQGGHYIRECRANFGCSKCSGKHHEALHHTQESRGAEQTPVLSTLTSLCTRHLVERKLFATVVVKVLTKNKGTLTLRALVDSGSEVSFVTSAMAQNLGGTSEKIHVPIRGLSDSLVGTSTQVKTFSISSLYDANVKLEVEAYVLPKVTSVSPPVTKSQRESWNHLKGLQLADPHFDEAGSVDLLLDLGVYSKILRSGLIVGENGAPSASNTSFGWMVFGTVSVGKGIASGRPVKAMLTNLQLDSRLKTFWEVERIPYPELIAPDEEKCEQLFSQEHKRRPDGSYEVPLPLKAKFEGVSQLGDSVRSTKSRFLRLERAFERDSVLHTKYKSEIESYFDLDHIEPIPLQPVSSNLKYSIPHHAVNTAGAKFRVVYDASCKTTSGKSLNDVTLVGPNLQTNLSDVITNWRRYRFCFQGDIAKMYRQIHVVESDRDYQRIFWRESKEDPLKEYRLKRLTFGINASPYLAIRTLHQLADDEQKRYPLAVRPIKKETYMDDVRSGGDSLEKVEKVLSQTVKCLGSGGFPLRKILSNSPVLLSKQPIDWIDPCTSVDLWQKDGVVKSLGVYWDTKRDVFTFRINAGLTENKPNLSKRDLISSVAMLFDPVGWISPVVLRAKLLIQNAWRENIGWDEGVSTELALKWEEIRRSLILLEKLEIRRWIGFFEGSIYELHGFGDASELAYATSVYIRVKTDTGWSVYLIASKTRVSPLLTETIPRLELCAAVITAELLEALEKVMGSLPSRICLWSDSTIVIGWLNSAPIEWNTFVSNRISKVQSSKVNLELRHVPSEHNPADLASRGCLANELLDNDLWWFGPPWLAKNDSFWPEMPTGCKIKPKAETVVTMYQTPQKDYEILEKFSSWTKAKRVMAWCFRFVGNCKKSHDDRVNSILSVKELKDAELRLVKLDQWASFHFLKLNPGVDVLEQLRFGSSKKRKKLLKLSPFVDKDNILRVGGRLKNSQIPFDRAHPIILSQNSELAPLIIKYAHKSCCHGGTQTVLNILRSRYWVLGGRMTVHKILTKCVTCKRVEPRLMSQLMGQLPSERIEANHKCFYSVGVDFAGPIRIRASRLGSRATRSDKSRTTMVPSYIALFVCLSTKAIHLEPVSELSTEAFLAALQRFVGRRGKPNVIYSDNGSNFKGADAKLKRDRVAALNHVSEDLKPELANLGISWKFIAPNNPHAGGLWEASVKTMKRLMYRTIQNTNLNFEELATLLCQIEAAMNSRPLFRASEDPSDIEVLTPNHLLNGGELMGLPDDPTTWESRKLSLRGWKQVQRLGHDFWRKWKEEYLHTLQPKLKWLRREGNLKLNELVLIKDDDLPARQWLRGRVIELKPGNDGLVRTAKIKTANSEFWRDIRHLALLPVLPKQ